MNGKRLTEMSNQTTQRKEQVSNMKEKMNKVVLFGVAALMVLCMPVIFGRTTEASAATKGYTIGTANVQVYSNSGLTKKYGAIYSTDEITINAVSSSYCKVTYPVTRGTKSGYIKTSTILTKTSGSTYSARGKVTTYRRPGGVSYGYISSGDKVTVLGASGSYTQVKYPVSGGYKYAFVTTANYNSYIAPAVVSTSTQTTSSVSRKCYIIGTSSVRVYSNPGLTTGYGWIYSSDEISVIDVTGSYCKVTYPVTRGTKTGYIATNKILTATTGNTVSSKAKITTYKRPGGASYGYIASGDQVMLLGTSGNYTQVKYPVSGGYKYAFVTTRNATNYLGTAETAGNAYETPVVVNNGSVNATVQANITSLAYASTGQLGTTYQRWAGISRYTAWCAAYATYLANAAMTNAGYTSSQALAIVPKQTSTAYMVQWYSSRGLYHSYAAWYNSDRKVGVSANTTLNGYTPNVGDLVAVDNDGVISAGPEHTAIVIAVNGDTITTAEGNTGSGNNATRRVKTYTYRKGTTYWQRSDWSTAKIVGFCSPQY
jgi:hypothetical protein